MKLILQSLGNKKTEINVNESDPVETIKQELIKSEKMPVSKVIKLIFRGEILNHTKKISDYKEIKDASTLIYVQSDPKVTPPPQPPSSVVTTTATSSAETGPSNPGGVAPLPTTFNGMSINTLRQYAITSVLGRIMGNSELFLTTLLMDPNMRTIQATDPAGFNNIIRHPMFLGTGLINLLNNDGGGGGADDGNYEDGNLDDSFSFGSTTMPAITSTENTTTPTSVITLTQDEKQFLDQAVQMVPEISPSEILQIYLACDKNKDATLNTLLNTK